MTGGNLCLQEQSSPKKTKVVEKSAADSSHGTSSSSDGGTVDVSDHSMALSQGYVGVVDDQAPPDSGVLSPPTPVIQQANDAAGAASRRKEDEKNITCRRTKKRRLYVLLLVLLLIIIGLALGLSIGLAGSNNDDNKISSSTSTENDSQTEGAPSDTETTTSNPTPLSEISTPAPSFPPPPPPPPPTTSSPTQEEEDEYKDVVITFVPGELTVEEEDLVLSTGLTAKTIARSGRKVQLFQNNGTTSSKKDFHGRPDFGATFAFPKDDPVNPGGWVYASNSEMEKRGKGGVGSLVFDKDGNVIDYKMVLTGTTMNCGGGRTPWNTWISCEEMDDRGGDIWQVDPFGNRQPEKTAVGANKGRFESFAYDVRDKTLPRYFATEDKPRGALRRYTPSPNPDWDTDPWQMLHDDNGTVEYLILHNETFTYEWITDREQAKSNAQANYPESEGIDVHDGYLYFTSKNLRALTILNLDDMTYTRQSTDHGLFDGKPDNIVRLLHGDSSNILYFMEENGDTAGIHGRDTLGRYFTILEGAGSRYETTGLAFSPNQKHMYFAFQIGQVYDITRLDGLPFLGKSLDVKYHNKPM